MKKEIYIALKKPQNVFATIIVLAYFFIILFGGCKKEICYDCQTYENATGVIWDMEFLCGEDEANDYVDVFGDNYNTAECIPE